MNSGPWVLIDASWLAYRALHTIRDLEFEDMPTGIIFGMFSQLMSVCKNTRVKSSRVAFFFDSRKSYRRLSRPEYKRVRQVDRTPEEHALQATLYRQMGILRDEILPSIGFPVFRQTGLESDDLIATAAAELNTRGAPAIIITADGDLYQCITPLIHWFDPSRNLYLDPLTFRRKKGISAGRWGEVKAIAGCPGDGVQGIKGVGETTAVKFLRGLLPKTYKTYSSITAQQGGLVIKRNNGLVTLPHYRTRPIHLDTAKGPDYDFVQFFNTCERYGLRQYIEGKRLLEWQAFFKGTLSLYAQTARKRGEHR